MWEPAAVIFGTQIGNLFGDARGASMQLLFCSAPGREVYRVKTVTPGLRLRLCSGAPEPKV